MNKHSIFFFLLSCFLISCGAQQIKKQEQVFANNKTDKFNLVVENDSLRVIDDNFLLKNKVGNLEMYVSGSPSEIGTKMGMLSQDLYHFQERALFEKVENLIPNQNKQKFLFHFLQFYNRNLSNHVTDEYKEEIYHLAQFASNDYDYLSSKYKRCLFLHGAHDIGHAFQDLMLVGCTSFAVWNTKSVDKNLLVGRNFDFYVNDDFAKNKIIAFVKPDAGYPFVSITWAGMIGVTSGMNLEGITVTLNAGKSSIPMQSKTPISLIAREILQYAKNIDEAIAIAQSREVFVSESILVSSGSENKAVIIEMAPDKFGVYEQENVNEIICSNHFQSEVFENDARNTEHKQKSHSNYRWNKVNESLNHFDELDFKDAISILRDTKGLNEVELGLGNEKALNQLYAHHSVVFKPSEKLFWVSSNPNQLAAFTAYDLDEIFNSERKFVPSSLMIDSLFVEKDAFIDSEAFKNFETFKTFDVYVDKKTTNNEKISEDEISYYIKLNPEFWLVYFKIGKYYYLQNQFEKAQIYFEKALNKEVTTVYDIETINDYLQKIRKKLK